jgi:hypothetical protein
MASNFSSLRTARKTALDKLHAEIKKENQKGAGSDERFWKLTVDQKTKIGYAVIRFLTAPKNEDVPWVRVFQHGFKLNGSWFIENCPTTIGLPCPVCKENNKLWESGIEADKDVVRERKRKLNFISNVLIVNDPAHAENNGKVFLFRYGKKIHDKIQELIEPQFPDQKPTNPFDLWEGADFKLKSAYQAGFQNYDKSEFNAPSPIAKDDATIEAIWEKQYPLQQFVAGAEFKSYPDLEKRFQKVLTGASDAPATAEEAMKQEQPTGSDAVTAAETVEKATRGRSNPTNRKAKPAPEPEPNPEPTEDDAPESEDDIKSFFAGVLND